MDYFEVPPGSSHILIPYTCSEHYDKGPFHEYPQRKGWTQRDLYGNDKFGGRSKREVESFFQSWLYFGTLYSVLDAGGVEINEADFVTTQLGERIVTTNVLPSKIIAWMMRWKGRKDLGPGCSAWSTTEKIFKVVLNYLHLFGEIKCPRSGSDSTITPTATEPIMTPVSAKISMSIIALGYTLSEAAVDIYEIKRYSFDKFFNYTSTLLKDTLNNNGWCASDVSRLFTEMGIDGHYYIALQECQQGKGKHTQCKGRVCQAANIDEKNYVTKHVNGCKRGEHLGTEKEKSATDKIVRIIGEEVDPNKCGIPVVCWKDNTEELVVEDARSGNVEYVAISHV